MRASIGTRVLIGAWAFLVAALAAMPAVAQPPTTRLLVTTVRLEPEMIDSHRHREPARRLRARP